MANRAISDLGNVTPVRIDGKDYYVTEDSFFPVSQNGYARKVTGAMLKNDLLNMANAYGGITEITGPVTTGLDDVYTIHFANTEVTVPFTVHNGKAIASIADRWAVSSSNSTAPSTFADTMQTMTPTNRYLWHYQVITFNNGDTLDTAKSVVGVYGDTGQTWYVYIRYSADQPTADADMHTTPDNWIGIYSGTASTAPTAYTAYSWFQYKGEPGATGEAASITTTEIAYQWSDDGDDVPAGPWAVWDEGDSLPPHTTGFNFLWSRVTLTYNSGTSTVFYNVSHFGEDGLGSVSSVNGISPVSGDVTVEAADINTQDNSSVQDHIDTLHTIVGDDNETLDGGFTAETLIGAANELKSEENNRQISLYSGKKVSVIGDSISTYAGYVVPTEDYASIDPAIVIETTFPSANPSYADITSVNDTWWMRSILATGATFEINASCTGSRASKVSTRPSLFERVSLLGNPDVIFVALGHNDSQNGVDLGEYDFTTAYTSLSETKFRPAVIKGLKALQATYPSAKIVYIVLNMDHDYSDSIVYICKELEIPVIFAEEYVAPDTHHPNGYGMKQISANVVYPFARNADCMAENFKDAVAITAGTFARSNFTRYGSHITISFQGESKTYAANDVLFTLPEGYRPSNQIFGIFTINAKTYGVMQIANTGVATIITINDPSQTGRIYGTFNFDLV